MAIEHKPTTQQEKIQYIMDAITDIRADLSEIKENLKRLDKIEQYQAVCEHTFDETLKQFSIQIENNKSRINDHENRIRNMEKMEYPLRLILWVSGAIGLSVIALIWSIITQQVTLVFK